MDNKDINSQILEALKQLNENLNKTNTRLFEQTICLSEISAKIGYAEKDGTIQHSFKVLKDDFNAMNATLLAIFNEIDDESKM